jgi:hypothetical protein
VAELTDPRLIKVRVVAKAGKGARGAGWALGTHGVLTARPVVAGMLDGDEAECLAVPDPQPGSEAFNCSVEWDDPERDLALLIIEEQQQALWASTVGVDPGPVLAEPGTAIVTVQAIGYPDGTLEDGFPVPEQTSGVLLPAAAAVTGSIAYDLDGRGTQQRPTSWRDHRHGEGSAAAPPVRKSAARSQSQPAVCRRAHPRRGTPDPVSNRCAAGATASCAEGRNRPPANRGRYLKPGAVGGPQGPE